MNGEVSQISRIVAAARAALRDGTELKYTPVSYEGSAVFNFCDRKNEGGMRFHAKDPSDWFEHLKSEGVKTIFMIESLKANRRNTAITNNSATTIFVRYNDGIVTRFAVTWSLDETSGKWNTEYTELIAENAPATDPEFRNEASMMEANLKDIANLANKLGETKYAERFRKSAAILNGETPKLKDGAVIPQVPEDMLKFYLASDYADVFGLSGSWNDEPAEKSKAQGLDKDFMTLSDRLFCSIRLMTMYAVNFPIN